MRPAERDRELREALEDRGYRVIVVRPGRLADQVEKYADIFRPM